MIVALQFIFYSFIYGQSIEFGITYGVVNEKIFIPVLIHLWAWLLQDRCRELLKYSTKVTEHF